MNVVHAIEFLRRFPQDAELLHDGRILKVYLFGYQDEGNTPSYRLSAPDKDLPWLTDPCWLDQHKVSKN